MFNKFHRPIPSPVRDLRPTQQTCEQCHWPKYFYDSKKINYNFYGSDENCTESKITMLVNVGGGELKFGRNEGIHWYMNIANEVTYYAMDDKRTQIPWVKSRNLLTGKETIYRSSELNFSLSQLDLKKTRKMDCMDCHNRPSHIYYNPNYLVNSYIASKKIDKSLPYIKRVAIQALENYVTDSKTAQKDVNNYIWNFYSQNYADITKLKKQSINQAVYEIAKIYNRNYFSYMKANWKEYPENIGHTYSLGCFRCHDGKHTSDDGKVISKDCNVCHIIISQEVPNQPRQESATGVDFIHPGGEDKMIKDNNCINCHRFKK